MKSPIPYIGGKSKLAPKICAMMPPHQAYCEVFAGAAWVLFYKEPSRYETINDLDGDLINFYRVLKHHPEEFLRQFKWALSSREIFEDFKEQTDARGLTDIQRAAMYYYLQKHAFGGRIGKNRSFGYYPLKLPKINLVRIEEDLSAVHLRLSRVQIENRPWQDFIRNADRPEVFFYLDPPYWGRKDYRHNLKPEDYREMAAILAGLKGQFLLSLDDRPEVREIFQAFTIETVTLTYTINSTKITEGKEVLIRSY